MRIFIVLLLLAGSALAEDAWDAPELAVDSLEAALESAKGEKDRPEAQDRAKILEKLIGTIKARASLPDASTAGDRLGAAKKEQQTLEASPAPGATVEIRTDEDLEKLKSTWDEAKGKQKAAVEALDHLTGRIAALETEARGLSEKLSESRRRLGVAGEGTDPYLLANLRLCVRADQERQTFVTAALDAFRVEKPVAVIQRDMAKLKEGRTRRTYEAAAEKFSKELERRAKEKQRAAERKTEEARLLKDPVHRFRVEIEQAIVKLDAEADLMKSRLPRWETAIATEERGLARIGRLTKTLDGSTAGNRLTPETADLLRLTRNTLLSRDRLLTGSRIPQLKQAQSNNQAALARLQQQMWQIEEPPGESLEFRDLLAAAGPEREGELRALWEDLVTGSLAAAAREQSVLLDRVETAHSRLGELYDRQIVEINSLVDEISSKLYFVRSNEVLGVSTFKAAREDLRKLFHDLKLGAGKTLARELLLLLLIALLAGIGGPLLIALLNRHLRISPDQPVKPGFWNMVFRLLRLAVVASLLPLLLLLIAAALRSVEEQGHLESAVRMWLLSAAVVLFILAFLRELLREEGPLVVRWRLSKPVAAQILGSVRTFSFALVFLMLPAEIGRELYQINDLPRLLETVFYVIVVWAMFRLVLRRKPLIRTWIGVTGPVYRLWILIAPAIGALLATIVVLDVAGYRVGANYLFQAVLRSYAMILFLALAYRLFAKGIRRLADRTLAAQQDIEGAERREISDVVMQQLTRVMGFFVVLVTALFLGDTWEFGGFFTGFFENLVLAQFADGTVLTVLDVMKAGLWVGGAHFIVHNLSGVMEFLVFPLIEEREKGGRYVLLTLSRYAILLVGYSAAFLSLNFNFQSLSVVIAAFSVGIGFGLQEIIGNFISGLILLIERPVRVGDVISVGTTGGTVDSITIRATVVTNWDNQQIIVPNKSFITQNVTNWTRNNDITKRKVPFSLAQGADIIRARDIMMEIVKGTTGVLADPPPRVMFQNFGESQLDFELWIHTHVGDGVRLMTEIRFEMDRRFKEESIELAIPRRKIETRESPEAAR